MNSRRTVGSLMFLAVLLISALGTGVANAAGVMNCEVTGFVEVGPPPGHVLGGGFDGGFNFTGAVMACEGTNSGVADIGATGTFNNEGGAITSITDGRFGTTSPLTEVGPDLDPVNSCTGDFSGTAIGTAAVLDLVNVDCGSITDGTGTGAATFAPTGAEQCEQANGDPDVCLSQVLVVANFVITDLD